MSYHENHKTIRSEFKAEKHKTAYNRVKVKGYPLSIQFLKFGTGVFSPQIEIILWIVIFKSVHIRWIHAA